MGSPTEVDGIVDSEEVTTTADDVGAAVAVLGGWAPAVSP